MSVLDVGFKVALNRFAQQSLSIKTKTMGQGVLSGRQRCSKFLFQMQSCCARDALLRKVQSLKDVPEISHDISNKGNLTEALQLLLHNKLQALALPANICQLRRQMRDAVTLLCALQRNCTVRHTKICRESSEAINSLNIFFVLCERALSARTFVVCWTQLYRVLDTATFVFVSRSKEAR